jgi:uncharacterized GH25 family protein
MKKIFTLVLIATMFAVNPAVLFAHEGEEHSMSNAMQGENDSAQGMPEGHDMHAMHAAPVATLREAAAALKESHPELAAKLEAMAEHMSQSS